MAQLCQTNMIKFMYMQFFFSSYTETISIVNMQICDLFYSYTRKFSITKMLT